MTKVSIFGGACGFHTVVEAKYENGGVKLSIKSDCKAVEELAKKLEKISYPKDFREWKDNNLLTLHLMTMERLRHVDCPVPCGIFKAILAELGLQLKKSPEIKFVE
ncbi:MAG: DUF6951 family protein [Candidatus Methanospirareceae archaeon]